MYPSDFEDMYLLNLQGHLNHLSPDDKKLNLTKPRWDATGFEFKHDYTVIDSPRAVTFRDRYGVQMIMRFNEIHKFSDGTLQQIDEALDYRVKEFRVNRTNPGMNTRFWTKKDVVRSKEFMFAIQKRLKTRRIFRNLESFVGGRIREGDYRSYKDGKVRYSLPRSRQNRRDLPRDNPLVSVEVLRIKLWWKWRYLVPVESIHSPMLTLNVFNQRHHDNQKTYNTASATLISNVMIKKSVSMPVRRMPPKRTSTSETPAITLDAIRQLTTSFTAALEAQTAAMASTSNLTGTPAVKMGNYKEFISCQPFYIKCKTSQTKSIQNTLKVCYLTIHLTAQ
ncbi:hypothetical protein Tco_1361084 [Tanacetum coccineum]